jgi:hypothetical protein
MQTKEELVHAIAQRLGITTPAMSTGSTEPKEIFVAVNRELGLGLDESASKPDLACAIVESAGYRWAPDFESRGSTVTASGLAAVLRAVAFFLKDGPGSGP